MERSGRTPGRAGARPEDLLGRLRPPERQILIRERGHVRYVSLSPRRQLAIAAAGLFALAGVISVLAALFVYDSRLSETQAALEESQASHRFLLSSLDGYKETFATVSRSVEDDVTSLSNFVEHSRLLQDELEMVKRRVSAGAPEHARAVALQQTISKDLVEMEGALKAVDGRGGRFKSSETQLNTAAAPQPPPVDPARAAARLDDIEARLAAMQTKEKDILQRLADSTVVQMEAAERQIRNAGLDVDGLLAELMGEGAAKAVGGGRGGPFVALSPETVRAARAGTQRRTDEQIKRWESVKHAVKFVPLAAPMRDYYLVSGFGPRTDPFNGRPAMHFGTDLSGPAGSSILATASGRVVFVGWKNRYGKTVEIDHGIGVRTRYGHMKRVSVRTGQSVRAGDELGEMGSTGRSTGAHLHYEIHVRGEPRDPMRFIKAGDHVRKS